MLSSSCRKQKTFAHAKVDDHSSYPTPPLIPVLSFSGVTYMLMIWAAGCFWIRHSLSISRLKIHVVVLPVHRLRDRIHHLRYGSRWLRSPYKNQAGFLAAAGFENQPPFALETSVFLVTENRRNHPKK